MGREQDGSPYVQGQIGPRDMRVGGYYGENGNVEPVVIRGGKKPRPITPSERGSSDFGPAAVAGRGIAQSRNGAAVGNRAARSAKRGAAGQGYGAGGQGRSAAPRAEGISDEDYDEFFYSGERGGRRPSGTSKRPSDKRIAKAPTVGQMRRKQHVSAMSSAVKAHMRQIATVVIIAAIVLAGAFALYSSNLLAVSNVTVTGNVHVSAEEVEALASVPADSTLLRLDAAGIEARIEEDPWVADAQVVRKWPDTVELRITERAIEAVVMVGGVGALGADEPWAIGSDGTWLAPVRGLLVEGYGTSDAASDSAQTITIPSKEEDEDDDGIADYYDSDIDGDGVEEGRGVDSDSDGIIDGSMMEGFMFDDEKKLAEQEEAAASGTATDSATTVDANQAEEEALAQNPDAILLDDGANVVTITDYSAADAPVAGVMCTDDGIQNALAVLGSLSSELLSQIVEVQASSVEQTTLTLENGVEVAFGSATDAEDKEKVVLELLSAHEGSISYINVRVTDRPTWRGLT